MAIRENQTLSDWINHHATTNPDVAAIEDAEGTLSYKELNQTVARLCSGLARIGIDKGDVVGVQLPNLREYIVVLLAVTARGGVLQTLHMPYRSKELGALLADSGAKAVIVSHTDSNSRALDVLSVKPDLPALHSIIATGVAPDGCMTLGELMSDPADPADRANLTTDDHYLLLYTSGTTAMPKGVPHIYRSFLNNALLSTFEMQIRAGDRILSLAPLTHLYGLFTVHLSLASGATTILIPAFNPGSLLDDLKIARATHVFAAPAHFAPFVARDALDETHLQTTRLLCLSGAAAPKQLAEAVDAKLTNGVVIQLWGMSELQAGAFGRPDDPAEKRYMTAGTAVPNTQLRVIGDDGLLLPAGEEGALMVRGPSVFAGYLNRPDENNCSFDDDGWFATGDLAILDADGFMTVTGRTKEIINRGGVKYNPVEVEELLMTLPGIAQCAIVPVPDPELGERGCLCAQLSPDSTLTLDEALKPLLAAGMAKYKWPEQLEIFTELPMTPTRKVMRGKLAEQVVNRKG